MTTNWEVLVVDCEAVQRQGCHSRAANNTRKYSKPVTLKFNRTMLVKLPIAVNMQLSRTAWYAFEQSTPLAELDTCCCHPLPNKLFAHWCRAGCAVGGSLI
eukprot:GHVT01066113.1.p1 GENE.GHVT01066113.1~~GHVT01066113.1.p1  ORF type:complete len:101 (+),score=4.79 GHVT01066113.1:361-663(+)